MYHIYSTLANSTKYVKYRDPIPGQHSVAERSVLIRGGTGINQQSLSTPMGIHTGISEEDYDWLKDDSHFKEHMKRGYIVARKSEVHPEVVAPDMAIRKWTKDGLGNAIKEDAFPIVPQEFNENGGAETIKPMASKKSKYA